MKLNLLGTIYTHFHFLIFHIFRVHIFFLATIHTLNNSSCCQQNKFNQLDRFNAITWKFQCYLTESFWRSLTIWLSHYDDTFNWRLIAMLHITSNILNNQITLMHKSLKLLVVGHTLIFIPFGALGELHYDFKWIESSQTKSSFRCELFMCVRCDPVVSIHSTSLEMLFAI